MPVTNAQLRTQMIRKLQHIAEAKQLDDTIVDDSTIHSSILATDDGASSSTSSKPLYKFFIRFFLVNNDMDDPKFPGSWIDMSVEDLADELVP